MRKKIKIINNFIKKKFLLNYSFFPKKTMFIEKKTIILCKYWIKDNFKYRIIWFGGICLSKKKKIHLSNFSLKNKIWNVQIIQQFYFFSPNLLSIKKLK